MRIGDSLTPINHETIANVLCNVARQDAFPLQTDWFVELDKEESREDEPETLEMQLSAKSIEISCFHCMSANLTGFTLNTQFFMTQQSHMMDTPSVAPRSTSTTKIELRFFSHTHTQFSSSKKPRPLIILMTAISLKATPMYTATESRRIVVPMKLSSGPLFMRALKDDRIRLKWQWRKNEAKLLAFHVTTG